MTSPTRITRPRILRAKTDRPLTTNEIRSCAPAVFQEQPAARVSESYAYLPSYEVLTGMLEQGFGVYEVAQARPYKADRDPYAKHMLRLRPPQTKRQVKVNDVVPELVLVNAHDGTARYYLYAGLYRYVCSNGMMVGDTFYSLSVAHRGQLTRGLVLEGSYKIIKESFPAMLQQVKTMQVATMKVKQQEEFANSAIALRYPGEMTPVFKPSQLLAARRPDDEGNTVWSVLNRVQENIIEGGFASQSFLFARRTTIRPVERVDARVNINRKLWQLAEQYL